MQIDRAAPLYINGIHSTTFIKFMVLVLVKTRSHSAASVPQKLATVSTIYLCFNTGYQFNQ